MTSDDNEYEDRANVRYIAHSPPQPFHYRQFFTPLKPVIKFQLLFGQSLFETGLFCAILSKILFVFLFLFMILVFYVAVFWRASIETWIQLSLYLTPLFTFPFGAHIFGSEVYYRLLHRNITDSFMVRLFVTDQSYSENLEHGKPSAHNRRWLKEIAIKSLLFPLLLEIIQWGGFFGFVIHENGDVSKFVGNFNLFHQININLWHRMYYSYWSLSVYLVGFVAFQFVFICRIVVKDTVNFMSLFGSSSLLKFYPVNQYKRNPWLSPFRWILNFLTMDLISSMSDQDVYSNSAHLSRPVIKNTDNESHRIIPTRVLTSPVGYEKADEEVIASSLFEDYDIRNDKGISPIEACEVFSVFIAEVEELTSIFTPFTVIIGFLGVANLVTHICLFVNGDWQIVTSWTFFRTILFLLVALRMLICVQQVTSVLGKLPTHIKFRKTSGGLSYMEAQYPSWDDLLELMNGFNLGKKSVGFPLTLRQVASIATFLNMAFLILKNLKYTL